MSLLGKILAILNLLAACAFAMLALMDYGKRDSWAHAVFMADLRINGLPVDDSEPVDPGLPSKRELDNQTLKQLFQPAGGNEVHTQEEELNKVYQRLKSDINGNRVEGTKVQKLARVLLPLAGTVQERSNLLRLITDPRPDDEGQIAVLQGAFDKAFSQPAKSSPEKRTAIAHVLFNVADVFGTPSLNRLVVVVGLEATVKEIDNQASLLRSLVSDTQQSNERERLAYLRQHNRLVSLVQDLAADLQRQKEFYAALEGKKSGQAGKGGQDEINKEQKLQRDAVTKRLEEEKANTKDRKDYISILEKSLDQARQKLGQAQKTNQEIEARIRELEKVKDRQSGELP